MYYLGLFGGMVFAGVVLMYKPDTRYVAISGLYTIRSCLCLLTTYLPHSHSSNSSRMMGPLWQRYSIQTWAMGEAKKRLESSGDEWQYKPSPNSGHPKGV